MAENASEEVEISARTGWVVAAFLLFWPLAVPALIQAVRAVRSAAAENRDGARRASRRALGFAVAGICVGTLALAGFATAVAMAPAWMPDGVKQKVAPFVPPALADGVSSGSSSSPAGPPSGSGTPSGSAPSGGSTVPAAPGGDIAEWWATAGPTLPRDPSRTNPVDLEVGDCLDTEQVAGVATLYWIPVLPCDEPHGGEVFGQTRLADAVGGGDVPTQSELWEAADTYCYPKFEEFVGKPWAVSELVYWPVAPSQESWEAGDRKVSCVVESPEEPVSESLQGAGR